MVMKVKVFEVSLDEKRSVSDERTLNQFLERVNVKKTSTQFINGAFNCWSVMVFYEDIAEPGKSNEPVLNDAGTAVQPEKTFTRTQEELLQKLKAWRLSKAAELNLPVFMICKNEELESLAIQLPAKLEDLKKLKGFGEQKVAKYGKELLVILKKK